MLKLISKKSWVLKYFINAGVKVGVPTRYFCCSLVSNQILQNLHLVTRNSQCCLNTGKSDITEIPIVHNFERISEDTIVSLSDYFEEVMEECAHLKDYDVSYGDGVLTVKFGEPYGTYVINRQTPNQQIWLSSPSSGPKRFDYDKGQWIYRHDGVTLHQLLDREVGNIVKHDVEFSKCSYSGTQ